MFPCEHVTYQCVSTDHIAYLIKSSKVKTCALDPLPVFVLTKCWPTLLPVITNIIVNCSLEEAFMPNALKSAMITPLLKKPNLNPGKILEYLATYLHLIEFEWILLFLHVLFFKALKDM